MLSQLKQVLIHSIKKNGNQPLTLQHLVNMISLIEKSEHRKVEMEDNRLDQAYMEIYADECCDRE